MSEWIPPISLIVLYWLFLAMLFENQRWARARLAGMRGASELLGIFVDLTHGLGTLFKYVFLVALAVLVDWRYAVFLFVAGFLLIPIYGAVVRETIGGDHIVLWLLGTFAVWILAPMLAWQVL